MAENPEVLDLSHVKPDPVAVDHAEKRRDNADPRDGAA